MHTAAIGQMTMCEFIETACGVELQPWQKQLIATLEKERRFYDGEGGAMRESAATRRVGKHPALAAPYGTVASQVIVDDEDIKRQYVKAAAKYHEDQARANGSMTPGTFITLVVLAIVAVGAVFLYGG